MNVIAKFNDSRHHTCTIDAVTIRTPMEGYNSPVAQVVVFASLGKLRPHKMVLSGKWSALCQSLLSDGQ